MSKKEYIGLTYDETQLRIAKVRLNNKKAPVLVSTHTIELTKPLDSTEDDVDADPLRTADTKDIFDLESSEETVKKSSEPDDFDVLTNFSDLVEDHPDSDNKDERVDEDPFNLAIEEDKDTESTEKRPNEILLTEYFEQCSAKKLVTGLHIPFGKTSFQLVKGVNPSEMKKRDRHEFFVDKLRPVHTSEIEKDQYSWVQLEPARSILAYTLDSYELLSLAETVQDFTSKKVVLKERLPDESIWAGMLRYNYDLSDNEITGLIAIGKSSSRVIFMRGGQMISILPIITEGEESSIVLNTIFSKILFELDKGDLPGIDRLLLVQSDSMGEMAKVYFQRQFENTEVDLLTLNQEKVVLSDPARQTSSHLQPYMTAIGAAFAAADVDKDKFSDFSLLPNYIREKQQLYKIEWHGAIILLLIGLTPLFLNYVYEQNAKELYQLNNEIALTEIQMESLRPLADHTESIQRQTGILNRENDYLLELARYSHEWSDVMQIINSGTSNIPGLWFTSIRNNASNLSISGFSMTREALPQLAELFSNVNIIQVNESEIREQPVYNFSMVVNNFRQDIPAFTPELPLPESRFMEMEDITEDTSMEQSQPGQITSVQPENSGIQTSPEQNLDPELTEQPDVPSTISEPVTGSSNYGLRIVDEETITGSFSIVLHSLQNEERARNESERLTGLGFKSVFWPVVLETGQTTWRVGVGQFESVSDALNSINSLPENLRQEYFISRIL